MRKTYKYITQALNISTFNTVQRLIYIPFHILAGIDSKIPPCCVLQYCIAWILSADVTASGWYDRDYQKQPNIGYFRCSLCIRRGHMVRIKYTGRMDAWFFRKLTGGIIFQNKWQTIKWETK